MIGGKSIGVATSLLRTLKQYRSPMPVDYLARIHGRSRSEIESYLESLEKEGLIELDKKSDQACVKSWEAA